MMHVECMEERLFGHYPERGHPCPPERASREFERGFARGAGRDARAPNATVWVAAVFGNRPSLTRLSLKTFL